MLQTNYIMSSAKHLTKGPVTCLLASPLRVGLWHASTAHTAGLKTGLKTVLIKGSSLNQKGTARLPQNSLMGYLLCNIFFYQSLGLKEKRRHLTRCQISIGQLMPQKREEKKNIPPNEIKRNKQVEMSRITFNFWVKLFAVGFASQSNNHIFNFDWAGRWLWNGGWIIEVGVAEYGSQLQVWTTTCFLHYCWTIWKCRFSHLVSFPLVETRPQKGEKKKKECSKKGKPDILPIEKHTLKNNFAFQYLW